MMVYDIVSKMMLILLLDMTASSSEFYAGMKISDISVDISLIYPISVMFDTISAMTDIVTPHLRSISDWRIQT